MAGPLNIGGGAMLGAALSGLSSGFNQQQADQEQQDEKRQYNKALIEGMVLKNDEERTKLATDKDYAERLKKFNDMPRPPVSQSNPALSPDAALVSSKMADGSASPQEVGGAAQQQMRLSQYYAQMAEQARASNLYDVEDKYTKKSREAADESRKFTEEGRKMAESARAAQDDAFKQEELRNERVAKALAGVTDQKTYATALALTPPALLGGLKLTGDFKQDGQAIAALQQRGLNVKDALDYNLNVKKMEAQIEQERAATANSYSQIAERNRKAKEDGGKAAETEIGKLNDDLKHGRITQDQFDNMTKKLGATGGMGSRESVFTQRIILSGNEAAKDLENVSKLPITTSTGLFGGRHQGPGLLDATKEVLTNKATSQDVQLYNVMATGFQRSLSAIESAGLAPSGSLTKQMDGVLLKEGDTNLTKLSKMAQIRQIVEAGLEVSLSNPRVSAPEKEKIQGILDKAAKAVPFTQSDVMRLSASGDDSKTIKDFMEQSSHPDDINDLVKKYAK